MDIVASVLRITERIFELEEKLACAEREAARFSVLFDDAMKFGTQDYDKEFRKEFDKWLQQQACTMSTWNWQSIVDGKNFEEGLNEGLNEHE